MRLPYLIIVSILISQCILVPEVLAKERKLKVSQVHFIGNEHYTDKRLMRLMVTRPSKFLRRVWYYPEVLADDIINIRTFYQNNGFLDVKTTEPDVISDSVKNSVNISITIQEGSRTHVEGLTIFGNDQFDDATLLQKVELKKDDPLNRTKIQDGMLSILSLYAEHGYLNAVVKPDIKINEEKHLAMIDLIVAEHQQFTISDIRIDTLRKTHRRIVDRELLFGNGEVVTYSKLQETQRNLYLTGLFESVFIRPVPAKDQDTTHKDILIEIKENLSSEFNAKIGYGSVEKIDGRVELLTTNLSGTAMKVSTGFSANFIKRRVEASFTEPWTFGTRFRTDLNLFYEYEQEPGYDKSAYGGRLTVGRSLGRNSNVSLGYRYENSELKNVEITTLPSDYDARIRSVVLTIIRDTRDNMFDTKNGNYQELSNEFAGSFLKGTSTFVRSTLRLKWFKSLNQKTTFGSAFKIGWMDYFGDSQDIPINERFYSGGPNSLRGFEYRMVGPVQNNEIPIGGRSIIEWNVLEIRRAVYKMMGVAVFVDVGNVWFNTNDININDFRSCTGVGIRATTSIGILRLDYSLNTNPESWEPSGMLYFSMGHAF